MKPHWFTRLLLAFTTATLVVLGFFFLTVALAIAAVVALVFGVRLWWTLRKLKRSPGVYNAAPMPQGKAVVEGEYQVIEQESRAGNLAAPAAPKPSNTPPAP